MGRNEYRRCYIPASSPLCRGGRLAPGNYFILYEGSDNISLRSADGKGYETTLSGLELLSLLAQGSKKEVKALENLVRRNKSAGGGYANHHVIPVHLFKKSQLIVTATEMGLTNLASYEVSGRINLNAGENIIRLKKSFHEKSHGSSSKYSKTIREYLEDRWKALVDNGEANDPESVRGQLLSLIDAIKEDLKEIQQASEKSTLDDYSTTYTQIISALEIEDE